MEQEMWLARDKDNTLHLYIMDIVGKPYKRNDFMWTSKAFYKATLPSHLFPEVQWSDEEPTKVKLIIEK